MQKQNKKTGAGRRLLCLFISGVFLFGTLLLGVLLFALPQQTFSPRENRVLQTLPKATAEGVFSGKWQEQFNTFTADQLAWRSTLTALGNNFLYLLGRRDLNGTYIGKGPDGEFRFFETPPQTDRSSQNLAALAAFAEKAKGAELTLMLCPSAGSVYTGCLPRFATPFSSAQQQQKAQQALGGRALNLLPALQAAAAENGSLYFKTDHHWTVQGAYTAYLAYCRAQGFTPAKGAGEFEALSHSFLGTLYAKTLLYGTKPEALERTRLNTDGVTVQVAAAGGYCQSGQTVASTLQPAQLYRPEALQQSDEYQYFLGGNAGLAVLENQSLTGGQTLLVFKDSFANCFAPFLTAHYRRVILLDARYFKGDLSAVLREFAPQKLLALYESNNFAADNRLAPLLNGFTGQ